MATNVIDICNICGESMIDPRILPCSHSFCLKCLESLKESPKCPTCQIKFEIPEGGLQEIKKNEFIEHLNNFSKIIIKCEICNENEAIKFCVDCKFHYCSTCLKPHERILASRYHILRPIKNKNVDKTYSNCEVHMKSMDVYCEDCKVLSCGECVALIHANHKMKNVSDQFESVIKNLEDKLLRLNQFCKKIVASHDNTEQLLNENEINACKLKNQIYEIGESTKNCVDSIVTKLHEDIDQILQNENPGNVLVTIKEMKNKIKNEIASLERNLNNLNYSNFVETNQEIMKNFEREDLIPNYTYKFNKEDVFKNNKNLADLQEFMKAIKKVQKTKNIKMVDFKDLNLKISNYLFPIASIQDEIFISDGSKRIKVFSYDALHLVRQYYCGLLTKIIDMLAVDDKLYVAGRDYKGDVVVVKYDNNFSVDPCEIFNLSCREGNFKLSKSFSGKSLLLIIENKIYQLSENAVVPIKLKFCINDALQIDERKYCICDRIHGICLIDDKSNVIKMFELPKDRHEVYKLVTDNYGFIYACCRGFPYSDFDMLVLDYNLNFVSKFNISKSNNTVTFCYNESRNTLVFFNDSEAFLEFFLKLMSNY